MIRVALVIAGILLILYVAVCADHRRWPKFLEACTLLLTVGMIVSGINIVLFLFDPAMQKDLSLYGIDVFSLSLATLALFWASAAALLKVWRDVVEQS